MITTDANALDAEKLSDGSLSAAQGTSQLQQSADVEHGVGDQDTDNYRIGKDGVASFQQIDGDPGHEEHNKRKGDEQKHHSGEVLHGESGGDQQRGND